MSEQDQLFMKAAARLAKKGIGRVSPNPMVGAVVVKDGRVIGEGAHRAFGGPHAEVEALEKAGEEAQGSTLYLTLEPCCHYGKTPPCTEKVIGAGVKEVICGMEDPFPEVAGKGFLRLREAGISVRVGVLEAECRRLNEGFIKRIETGLPFVTLKSAMTLDGKIATRIGESKWITSEASRRKVQRLRYASDIVLTGSGTVLADDPMLIPRGLESKKPTARRAVLYSMGELPLDRKVFQSAREHPTTLFVPEGWSPPEASLLLDFGVEIHEVPLRAGGLDLRSVLGILGKRSCNEVMVEAGSRLSGAFFEADLVDRWVLYAAPMILGDEKALSVLSGRKVERLREGKRLVVKAARRVGGDLEIVCERG